MKMMKENTITKKFPMEADADETVYKEKTWRRMATHHLLPSCYLEWRKVDASEQEAEAVMDGREPDDGDATPNAKRQKLNDGSAAT